MLGRPARGRHRDPPAVVPRGALRVRRRGRPACSTPPPVVRVKRPRVSDRSSTTGLTETELIALLGAADADGPRSAALITLLALNVTIVDRPQDSW